MIWSMEVAAVEADSVAVEGKGATGEAYDMDAADATDGASEDTTDGASNDTADTEYELDDSKYDNASKDASNFDPDFASKAALYSLSNNSTVDVNKGSLDGTT